jgi:hypothetical protein
MSESAELPADAPDLPELPADLPELPADTPPGAAVPRSGPWPEGLEPPPRVRPGGQPRKRAERARAAGRRPAEKPPPLRDRAEYMAAYRARKAQEQAVAADDADDAEARAKSGVDPETGEFTPRFPGQRPPFNSVTGAAAAGSDKRMVSGSQSERKIGPVAAAIKAELLSDPECPDYLKDRIWGPAIDSWAHAEAVVRLLRSWLDQHDIGDALTEFTDEDETVHVKGNRTRRVSRGRRVHSVIEQLRQAEGRAERARQRIGLDPLARARLGKDILKSTFDLAAFLAETAPVAEVRRESEAAGELPPGAGAGGEGGTAAGGQ